MIGCDFNKDQLNSFSDRHKFSKATYLIAQYAEEDTHYLPLGGALIQNIRNISSLFVRFLLSQDYFHQM